MDAFKKTNFSFPGQTGFYRGKVRDVYYFGDRVAMVATDRISAFDVVLPRAIPDKGRILNQIAARHIAAVRDISPSWLESVPDPNVSIGKRCVPIPVEMVVRGHLVGHAWRQYQVGVRTLCGVPLAEGLRENDALPTPIITPTTKATIGHDIDISREEILMKKLVSEEIYLQLEKRSLQLFARGQQLAKERRLILADTKYEFGIFCNQIYLIDEIHTPDSSRYFHAEGFEERQRKGEPQKQLSKEFVRQWLIANHFQGKERQDLPLMDDVIVASIANRYRELYQLVTNEPLPPLPQENLLARIEKNIIYSLHLRD